MHFTNILKTYINFCLKNILERASQQHFIENLPF